MADPHETVRKVLAIAINLHGSDAEHDRNQAQAAIQRAEALIAKHGLNRTDFRWPGDPEPEPAPQASGWQPHSSRARGFHTGGPFDSSWFNDVFAKMMRREAEAASRRGEAGRYCPIAKGCDMSNEENMIMAMTADIAAAVLWFDFTVTLCFIAGALG